MRTLTRDGFGLIELLLGMVVLGLFAATMVVVVRTAAMTAARAAGILLADRAVTGLRLFAQEELRDAADSDIAVLSSTRLALSRPIGEAIPCTDLGGAVLIPDTAWSGTRQPVGGRDDAWLLLDPAAGAWERLPIDSVAADRCPLSGASATSLLLPPHAATTAAIRVVEPVELRAYRSGSADWFGLQPATLLVAVQPFAGPLMISATRFVWQPGRLDIVVPPRDAPSTLVQIPLGSAP